MGIVNMNGRMYDPNMARMMSADPLIQNADDLQNYNRYSYLTNNPLNATDPTGHFKLSKLLKFAAIVVIGWNMPFLIQDLIAASAGTAAGATSCINVGAALGTKIVAAAVTGATIGLISSNGDPNGAIRGAVIGGLFGAVGASTTEGTASNYAGHAAVGCLDGMLGGNGCGRGAASAAAGKFTTVKTDGWGNVEGFIASSVGGGVVSAIGGGKFENGATTAAFGYLFNHVLSKADVGKLYRVAGHHPFAKQWANEYRDLISGDALNVLSKETIGVDVAWDGDHPNKWGKEHKAYNDVGGRKIVEDFFKEKSISPTNQLDVRNSYELLDRLKRHDFNVQNAQYVDAQRSKGRMNWKKIFRGGAGGMAQPGD